MNPDDLLLRTDFCKFADAAKREVLWNNDENNIRVQLTAHPDPYVMRCVEVRLLRGPKDEGYPFLDQPIPFTLIVFAMKEARPHIRMVRSVRHRKRMEWYFSPLDQRALVQRFKILAHVAARTDSGAKEKPVVVLPMNEVGGRYRQPKDSYAFALKEWRRQYASQFTSIHLCCRGWGEADPGLKDWIEPVINRIPKDFRAQANRADLSGETDAQVGAKLLLGAMGGSDGPMNEAQARVMLASKSRQLHGHQQVGINDCASWGVNMGGTGGKTMGTGMSSQRMTITADADVSSDEDNISSGEHTPEEEDSDDATSPQNTGESYKPVSWLKTGATLPGQGTLAKKGNNKGNLKDKLEAAQQAMDEQSEEPQPQGDPAAARLAKKLQKLDKRTTMVHDLAVASVPESLKKRASTFEQRKSLAASNKEDKLTSALDTAAGHSNMVTGAEGPRRTVRGSKQEAMIMGDKIRHETRERLKARKTEVTAPQVPAVDSPRRRGAAVDVHGLNKAELGAFNSEVPHADDNEPTTEKAAAEANKESREETKEQEIANYAKALGPKLDAARSRQNETGSITVVNRYLGELRKGWRLPT